MINKPLAQANQEIVRRASLGLHLRAARQGRNISLAEASTATRISQRILTALEDDDFAALPAEVFTRGFIKLYAEYLGLDTGEVLTLFTDQENLDPEKPADRPYRSDILHGKAMANPLNLLKGNPRLRIILILLIALLSFYVLGAIFKSLQKHPEQDSPENEVAKSLVNGQPQILPATTGEGLPAVADSTSPVIPGAPALSGSQPEPQSNALTGVASPQAPVVVNEPKVAPQTQATPPSATARTDSRGRVEGAAQTTTSRAAVPAPVPTPTRAEPRRFGTSAANPR